MNIRISIGLSYVRGGERLTANLDLPVLSARETVEASVFRTIMTGQTVCPNWEPFRRELRELSAIGIKTLFSSRGTNTPSPKGHGAPLEAGWYRQIRR